MNKLVDFIKKNKIGDYKENISLSKYTTYKVGGIASILVLPKNVDKLKVLLEYIKNNNITYKIIGNGSNLIFSDDLFDGVIIKLDNFNNLEIKNTIIKVGAAYSIIKLANKACSLGLTGLEFAAGIPGTIGGCIYMNAGAYNSDMGYIVSDVTVLDPKGKINVLYNKDLDFHYRSSFFQKNKDYTILEATIVLKKGQKEAIREVMEDRKKRRILSQPLDMPSAGSVFRNPTDNYAGKLIEDCNLKGYEIGGAQISLKHANFIVNKNNATAKDVRDLILLAKQKVKDTYGIDLKIEQEFVNWKE